MMLEVNDLTEEEFAVLLDGWTTCPPIEQTPEWQRYQATIPGRSPWGCLSVSRDGEPVAAVSFLQYETHGYRYLRAGHAPVWREAPSEADEAAAVEAIAARVRKRDRGIVFLRMAVMHELPSTRPCLSTLPYDTTVIVDVTGGDEAILSRMKPRGRRDVRKSLRECPCELADETAAAAKDFAPYYQVMCETGARDGFVPAPMSDFQDMVSMLGAGHARVYAGRNEGQIVAWSLVTVSGTRATRYYAATAQGSGHLRVADSLLFFECRSVAELGCTEYDLMGIGSEFAPETLNLNEFKTKFAKDGVVKIAPDRDVPVHRGFYAALSKLKGFKDSLRKEGKEE